MAGRSAGRLIVLTASGFIEGNKFTDKLKERSVTGGWVMKELKTIILEKKDGIGYLTLNRPEVFNAISQ
jgi:hypothetical protein